MTGDPSSRRRSWGSAGRIVGLGVGGSALVLAILFAGVWMATAVAQRGTPSRWTVLSNVGQAFGVITAVFSGFGFTALLVTFWMQLKELREQRTELALQRETLALTQSELHKASESALRRLHVDLIQMAMKNTTLAAVWPTLEAGISDERNSQYLYANLILQHAWLQRRLDVFTDAELEGYLRYVFTSPLIRAYWQATKRHRANFLVPGTPEHLFEETADQICRVYEEVLTCAEGWERVNGNRVGQSKGTSEPPDIPRDGKAA